MDQQFVDRNIELNFLEKKYLEARSQLIIIYGRRRIGKTELLLKFAKEKPYIYFLCEKSDTKMNIRKMARKAAEYLGKPGFGRIEFLDWEDFFREFFEWKKDEEKVIIILDEFPYLIEIDDSTLSIFQKIWDEYLSRRRDVMLILCGSSIGMMETEVLGYKSPLYGRRTGQWKLRELDIKYIREFVPGYDVEDILYVYGALGGIPAYLAKLDPSLQFYDNVYKLFFNKGGELYEEAENLLKQELREPRIYKLILTSLAEGHRRVTEIANSIGLDKATVSRYLETLTLLDIVGYETPVLEKPKTKKRLYYIKDNYFNFWFTYVYPYRDLVEEDRGEKILEIVRESISKYMSRIFEHIALKFIYRIGNDIGEVIKAGRQWGRTKKLGAYEIDIVALNSKKEIVSIFEVKWANLSRNDTRRILKSLKYKIDEIGLEAHRLGIIAKHIHGKEELKKDGFLLYDLKDIEIQLV